MKTPASVVITRDSLSVINIRIRDLRSGQTVTASMNCDTFARVVTGLSCEAEMECPNPEVLGRQKVSERRTVTFRGTLTREQAANMLQDEPGWITDRVLREHDSFRYIDGNTVVNYRVYRYEVS